MATPTCNGTVSIKSACSSTSADQSNVSTPVSDVAQVKSGDKLKGRVRFQSSELLGRRLFTETEAPPTPQDPIESDCLTQNHITAIAGNLSTHSIDLFNSPSKPVSPSDDNNSPMQSQSLSIKSPSLDVLFMSNSQLDVEDSKRLTACTPPLIHPPIDKGISMNDGLVVSKGLVKFVYPTSDKVAPPKRPRPPGLSRLKFSDKKFRIISPHSPSTNKTTPIGALDTPTGRPRPLVNEQLNHSAPAITSTFVPAVTSTPFPTPTRAHDNDKGQLECSEFKTGFGKDSVKPLEKADDAEHIEDDGSLHLPVDMDLEEFSTFTQIQPADFNDDDDDRATSSKEVTLNVDLFNVKPHLLTTPLSSLGNTPSDLDKRLIGKNHEIASSAGVGFVTAKGNKIKVSSTAIERATLLLASSADDDDNQKTPLVQSVTNEPLHKSVSFCFRGNESSMLNAESTSTSLVTSKDTLTCGYVTGFTTGDGRSISVRKDSLDKATSLIDDHRDDDGHIETANDGRFITGDVERLTLHTTKGLCIDDDQNGDNEEVIDRDTPAVSHGGGFTTAGGRNVSVSEKSLAAVKQLFNDDEEVIDRDTPAVSCGGGFTTAGGRNVSVSEKSLAAVKQLFNDNEGVIDRDTPAVSRGGGFTTAGGRNVSVSEKSLAAVKQLFSNESPESVSSNNDDDNNAVAIATVDVEISSQNVDTRNDIIDLPTSKRDDDDQRIKIGDTPVSIHSNKRSWCGLPRRGKVAKPEMLCDRNHPLKPKQILRMGPDEATPMATPSHIKFQTTTKNKKNKISANNNNPVWKGDMSVVGDTSADPLMLLSPIDLTTSQLHSFIQSSPLSPDTLDSSRSSHLTTPVNVPPPPPRPCGRVERQGGTIVSSREHPNCHRVSLVSMATDCGRVGGYSREELLMKGVSPSVFSVTAATAGQFVFDGADHFSAATLKRGWVCVGDGVILKMEDGKAGIEELWNSFSVSPGVDIKLINYNWFANHYHWIVWKLASLEVCFPDKWAGRALTVDWCLMQLKYRYDIEIDKAKRSILHKICEGDDTASRPMILCVNDVSSTTASNGEVSYSLQLTDGWYKVPAVLDNPLSSFVSNGSIKIGTKLLLCGADLTNSDSPNGNPLEVWKEKSFSLSANSVRRCCWYSRLGIFCGQIPSFSLSSLIPGGGLAPSVNVVVARSYPILYVEKTPDGKRVGRRYKDEEKAMEDWEKKRQKVTEMICQRVEKEFEEELETQSKQKKRRSVRFTSRSIKQLNNGEDIYSYFQSSSDPDSLMEALSSTQLALLESYRVALASKRQEEFQTRLKEAVEMSKDQMPAPRNVSALLKVLLVQYGQHHSYCECMLNIWNCKHELEEIMKEGTPLKITNVRSQNYHKIHLTSTKTTQFKVLPSSGQDMIYYQPRSYTPLSDLTSIRPPYNEIDTVGLVVTTCTELLDNNRSVDKMYLTDHDGYLLVVKIWEGLASMMSEGSIKEGCVVAISNLCYHQRGNRGMPMASACDRTVITQCPHERHFIMAMDEFRQKLPVDCSDLLESMNDYCINKTK